MVLTYELITDTRPKLGLVVLQSDESIEADFRRLLPPEVDLLVTRVPSSTTVTSETLAQMAHALTRAVSLFPQGMSLDAVGYGCTSGTAEIGIDEIAGLVQAGVKTRTVTQPVSSLIAACSSLKIKRLGLISPYIETVSARVRDVLADHDIAVTGFASFEEAEERNVVRISPASITNAAISLAEADSFDGLFLSCTNLRTLDIIPHIEQATGLPVLSSNQVLVWHLLQMIGVKGSVGPGKLWQT